MNILSMIYRSIMLLSYLIGRVLGAFLYGAKKFNSSFDTHSLPAIQNSTPIERKFHAPSPAVSPIVPSAEEHESVRYVTVIREHEMRMPIMPIPSAQMPHHSPDYDYDKPFRNTLDKYNDNGRFNMRWL